MNRRIALLFVLCAVLAGGVFGQSGTALLNTKRYLSYFGFAGGQIDNLGSDYIWAAADAEIERFGALNIDPATAEADDTRILTDIPVEFALLSYYSEAVVKIRPTEADAILPAGDARLSTLKLGAALYQDIVVLRFLNDTAALARYENMLKFICDGNGVSRAEVENYFRNGIQGLIVETVVELYRGQPTPSRRSLLMLHLVTFFKTPTSDAYKAILDEYKTRGRFFDDAYNHREISTSMLETAEKNGWTDQIAENRKGIADAQEMLKEIEELWGNDVFGIVREVSPLLWRKLADDYFAARRNGYR